MTSQTTRPPRVQKTRDKIIAAAMDLFLSRGFTETRMDEVATKANVSKQTLYAHAGSKEALFLEMAETMIARAVGAQRDAAPDPKVSDAPRTFLRNHARQQLRTAHDANLMQIRRVAIAEVGRFPAFGKAVFALGPGSSIGRLERAFRMWHDAGALNTPDPRQAAEMFNWLIMGGPTSEVMLTGQTPTAQADTSARHIDECLRIFWAAYGV